MRWRKSRPDAEQPAESRLKHDKFSSAIRQRRTWTAQERVRALPGFGGLEHRWCDFRGAYELDQRRDALPELPTRQWPDADALVAALRSAATQVPPGSGFARLDDEPEALWVEAVLADLLQAMATALSGLREGFVILADDDRALIVTATRDGDGPAAYGTALQGAWPEGMLA